MRSVLSRTPPAAADELPGAAETSLRGAFTPTVAPVGNRWPEPRSRSCVVIVSASSVVVSDGSGVFGWVGFRGTAHGLSN
jgi:hypothetical protein